MILTQIRKIIFDNFNNIDVRFNNDQILELLRKDQNFDQSITIDDLETEFLPLYCNWITSNLLPKYDEKENTFVVPFLPNYKIGIMHLAAGIWKDGKDMRIDKSVKIEIETLNNNKLSKTLRFEK